MADNYFDDCNGEAVDLGQRGLRIASIFIILAASLLGAVLPIMLARQSKLHMPKITFFICKYIGTGVIIATAWLHLLAPAAENLSDPCLSDRLGDYPWPFAIALWTVLLMFCLEMMAMRAADKADARRGGGGSGPGLDQAMDIVVMKRPRVSDDAGWTESTQPMLGTSGETPPLSRGSDDTSCTPRSDTRLLSSRNSTLHKDGMDGGGDGLGSQLLAIFILEFGVVFHSVLIGLTLGTTDEVPILLVVLVFHQMFEGLGLGSRLAVAPWPSDETWLPYLLGVLFAISTPIGAAAGMLSQPRNASAQKLVSGIFDAVSAGILMYTGLVELLAHEFMFNPHMLRAPLWMLLLAFASVGFGSAVMAVLAVWA